MLIKARILFVGVIFFIVKPTMLVLFFLQGFKSRSIGKCSFYGSVQFLDRCEVALRQLHEMDEDIFLKITGVQSLTFYHNSRSFDNSANNFYSVSDEFLRWDERGIITRIVYASLMSDLIGKTIFSNKTDCVKLHGIFHGKLGEWLKTNNFPQEIVKAYLAN